VFNVEQFRIDLSAKMMGWETHVGDRWPMLCPQHLPFYRQFSEGEMPWWVLRG